MMRYLLAACLFAVPLLVKSQGFDWQYSVRQPSAPPTTFLGFEAGYGRAMHSGGLEYVEQVPCCQFAAGEGVPMWLSAVVETWQRGDVALWAGVGYGNVTATFASDVQEFPLYDGRTLRTEYAYNTAMGYLSLQGGLRFRPLASNVTIGAALRLGTLIHSSSTLEEVVLSPSDYQFTTNPPSQRHLVDAGRTVASASAFLASVALTGGYDISLARGMYVTPTIVVGLPLTTTAANADWRTFDVSFALRFLTAFGSP